MDIHKPTEEELNALDNIIDYVVNTLMHDEDEAVERDLDLVIKLREELECLGRLSRGDEKLSTDSS